MLSAVAHSSGTRFPFNAAACSIGGTWFFPVPDETTGEIPVQPCSPKCVAEFAEGTTKSRLCKF